jgi:hypothetical protein
MIEDIRSWVYEELEGIEIPNNDQLTNRYNSINKILKICEKDSLPIPQNLLDEKKQIEEDLKDSALPDEEFKEVLSVADKLSKLSKDIK